jgi:hypothetical protein
MNIERSQQCKVTVYTNLHFPVTSKGFIPTLLEERIFYGYGV